MGHSSQDANRVVNLCSADADALDRVIESLADQPFSSPGSPFSITYADAGISPEPSGETNAASTSSRMNRVCRIMSLIQLCACESPPADLTQRTIARVIHQQQRQRFAQQIQSLTSPQPGFQWRELLTVAAVLMIGLSLLWPMMIRSRAQARKVACADHLATAGAAFGRYAADHRNTLPRGQVKPGTQWWNVGQAPAADGSLNSNSAHLFILVRRQYASPHTLACPDNSYASVFMPESAHDWSHASAVSYSYQNQYTPKPIRIDLTPDLAILADKNPLFVIRSDGLTFRPNNLALNSPSRSHNRLNGQNVLRADGSTSWTVGPVLPNGDNIWLIRDIHHYRGNEAPQDLNDAFLVP